MLAALRTGKMAAMSSGEGAIETFRTHANYIRAFATLAGFDSTIGPKRALSRLAGQAAAFPVPNVTAGDPRQVFDCLHRAWGPSASSSRLSGAPRRFAGFEPARAS